MQDKSYGKKSATVEPVKKRGRGRPPKGDDALTEGMEVRFRRAERRCIELAAQMKKLAPSAYVREAAVAAANRDMDCVVVIEKARKR